MNFCWIVILVLFLGVFFHFLVMRIMRLPEVEDSLAYTLIGVGIAFLVALPGWIFFVIETSNYFSQSASYHEFRTFPFIELLLSLTGALTGGISGVVKRLEGTVNVVSFSVLIFVLVSPFAWSFGTLINANDVQTSWSDKVCVSKDYRLATVASVATIMKYYDIQIAEFQLAKECFVYRDGVHIWYVANALSRRGLKTVYHENVSSLESIEYPVLARVKTMMGEYYVPILAVRDGVLDIGDPMKGRIYLPIKKFIEEYQFTGFLISVQKAN